MRAISLLLFIIGVLANLSPQGENNLLRKQNEALVSAIRSLSEEASVGQGQPPGTQEFDPDREVHPEEHSEHDGHSHGDEETRVGEAAVADWNTDYYCYERNDCVGADACIGNKCYTPQQRAPPGAIDDNCVAIEIRGSPECCDFNDGVYWSFGNAAGTRTFVNHGDWYWATYYDKRYESDRYLYWYPADSEWYIDTDMNSASLAAYGTADNDHTAAHVFKVWNGGWKAQGLRMKCVHSKDPSMVCGELKQKHECLDGNWVRNGPGYYGRPVNLGDHGCVDWCQTQKKDGCCHYDVKYGCHYQIGGNSVPWEDATDGARTVNCKRT